MNLTQAPLQLLHVITQVEERSLDTNSLITPRNKLVHFFSGGDRSTICNSLHELLSTYTEILTDADIPVDNTQVDDERADPSDDDVLDMLVYLTMMCEPHCGLRNWMYSNDHTNGLDRNDCGYPRGTDSDPAYTDSDHMTAVLQDIGLPTSIRELRVSVENVCPVVTTRGLRPVFNNFREGYCGQSREMEDIVKFIDGELESDEIQANLTERDASGITAAMADRRTRGFLFDTVKRVKYGGDMVKMMEAIWQATGRSAHTDQDKDITDTTRLLKQLTELLKLRSSGYCCTLARRRQLMRELLIALPGWARLPARFAQDFEGALYSRTRTIPWKLMDNADFGDLAMRCLEVAQSEDFLQRCREAASL